LPPPHINREEGGLTACRQGLYLNNYFIWDTNLCWPLKINIYFGRKYCLYLQCRKLGQARNKSQGRRGKSWKRNAKSSCNPSFQIQRITRHYIPENGMFIPNTVAGNMIPNLLVRLMTTVLSTTFHSMYTSRHGCGDLLC
jgi:hypothetical protein